MAREYTLSEKDYHRIQKMLRWFEHGRDKTIQRRMPIIGGSAAESQKIFEVQTIAESSAYGLYNCFEQTIDSTYWNYPSNYQKIIQKEETPTAVKVLNLGEDESFSYNPVAPALALYDKMMCWQVLDDEGNSRYVGVPLVRQPRPAKTMGPAGASWSIEANLILNNGNEAAPGQLGYDIYVYLTDRTTPGTVQYQNAFPYLANDKIIHVVNHYGRWYLAQTLASVGYCT